MLKINAYIKDEVTNLSSGLFLYFKHSFFRFLFVLNFCVLLRNIEGRKKQFYATILEI